LIFRQDNRIHRIHDKIALDVRTEINEAAKKRYAAVLG